MKNGKHKNDPVDAADIATMLRTNHFPLAYDYPSEMRSCRNLLRRRHFFVRERAASYTHFQNTFTQHRILDPLYAAVQKITTRQTLLERTDGRTMMMMQYFGILSNRAKKTRRCLKAALIAKCNKERQVKNT